MTCSACGKTIEKIPAWMNGVKIEFICTNCPNRQTKNIALMSLELDSNSKKTEEVDDEMIEDEDED